MKLKVKLISLFAKYAKEDEEGFTPFTYMWNTQGLSVGEHIFTVNIHEL